MKLWLGLFFIIGLTSGWILLSDHQYFSHKKPTLAADVPVLDGYMTDAHLTQYDSQGQVHSSLYTPKMTHFHQDNTSYFDHPQVIAYSAKRIPWQVTAKFGKAIHDGDQVDLWGGVLIHQSPQPKVPETLIQTEAMTVYPHQSYAVTKQSVTFTRPDAHIQSIGMEAYFKEGIFKLTSAAQGTYAPAAKNS